MMKHRERVHYDEAQREGTLLVKHRERVLYDEARREGTL